MNDVRHIKHEPRGYSSLVEFVRRHELMLPRPHATWRLLVHPCVGSINGLEATFSGLAIATNGVILAIETSAGKVLFAHLQWFIKDNLNEESDIDAALEAAQHETRTKKNMKELFNSFSDCF